MNKRVLLVEDNEDNRMIYATILGHCGYSVTEAPNGLEGVSRAESELPDLIVMDISLPIIDGLEATRRIRANPTTADIPVLAVTAHAQDSDRQRAMAAGCSHYLAKPVEPRALVREVEKIIGPSALS
ncbi:MAG TPA: response regulator [Longimicrobiales bacterium]|nr:response regulator [Longimicrobiales bacterium]